MATLFVYEMGKLIAATLPIPILKAKYKASFEEIKEATELGFFTFEKKQEHSKMSPEEFHAWLEERRRVKKLAKEMADAFLDRMKEFR